MARPTALQPSVVAGLFAQPDCSKNLVRLVEEAEPNAVPWFDKWGWIVVAMTGAYRDAYDPEPAELDKIFDAAVDVIRRRSTNDQWGMCALIRETSGRVTDLFTGDLTSRKLLGPIRSWAWVLSEAPNLPQGSVELLVDFGDVQAIQKLGWHRECLGEPVAACADRLLKNYPRRAKNGWGPKVQAFPSHPGLDPERFDRFVRYQEFFGPGLAASHHASDELLDALSRHTNPSAREAVARNPRTRLPTLIDLANRGPSYAQRAARNRQEVAAVYGWGSPDRLWRWEHASEDFIGTPKQLAAHLETNESAEE